MDLVGAQIRFQCFLGSYIFSFSTIHIILARTFNYKFLTFYLKIENYHHMPFMIHIERSL